MSFESEFQSTEKPLPIPMEALSYEVPQGSDWRPAVKIVAGVGLIVGALRTLAFAEQLWWYFHQPKGTEPIFVFFWGMWFVTGVTLMITLLFCASSRPAGRRFVVFGEGLFAATYTLSIVIQLSHVSKDPNRTWAFVLSVWAWQCISIIAYSIMAMFILSQPEAKKLFSRESVDSNN
jgi:hypothetical protein